MWAENSSIDTFNVSHSRNKLLVTGLISGLQKTALSSGDTAHGSRTLDLQPSARPEPEDSFSRPIRNPQQQHIPVNFIKEAETTERMRVDTAAMYNHSNDEERPRLLALPSEPEILDNPPGTTASSSMDALDALTNSNATNCTARGRDFTKGASTRERLHRSTDRESTCPTGIYERREQSMVTTPLCPLATIAQENVQELGKLYNTLDKNVRVLESANLESSQRMARMYARLGALEDRVQACNTAARKAENLASEEIAKSATLTRKAATLEATVEGFAARLLRCERESRVSVADLSTHQLAAELIERLKSGDVLLAGATQLNSLLGRSSTSSHATTAATTNTTKPPKKGIAIPIKRKRGRLLPVPSTEINTPQPTKKQKQRTDIREPPRLLTASSAASEVAVLPVKRPRGRPRKVSADSSNASVASGSSEEIPLKSLLDKARAEVPPKRSKVTKDLSGISPRVDRTLEQSCEGHTTSVPRADTPIVPLDSVKDRWDTYIPPEDPRRTARSPSPVQRFGDTVSWKEANMVMMPLGPRAP